MARKIYSPTITEAVDFTAAQLRESHVPANIAHSIVAATTEGVGNAIRHATKSGNAKFILAVIVKRRHVTVEVTDFGPGFSLDGQHMPSPLSEGKRGIPLMKALMDSVEYIRSANGNRLRLKKSLP